MSEPEIASQVDSGRKIGEPVDSRSARLPERTVLRGRDVTVVSLEPHVHGSPLYRATHGADRHQLWLYLLAGPFASESEFVAHLNRRATAAHQHDVVILDNRSGNPVGSAAYLNIDPVHRRIEVGSIVYTSLFQQTRGATEAMYLLAGHAFDDLGYRRYEWKCDALNGRSRRAALRLGFEFEGVFRQHMIVKGRNRDTAWYAITDVEWPARKARLERWLDPGNFDAAGRQLTSLSSSGS